MELRITHPISYKTAITLALYANELPKLYSEEFYEFGDTQVHSLCCNYDLHACLSSNSLLAPDVIDLRERLNKQFGVFVQYVVSPGNINRFCFEIVDKEDGKSIFDNRDYANYFTCLNAGLNKALQYILTNRLNRNANAEIKQYETFIQQTINK